MQQLLLNVAVAALLIGGFGTYLFWPRKIKGPGITDLQICKSSYRQIKQEIEDCRTVLRLNQIQSEADDFLTNYYEKTDSKTVRMYYVDLCLKIGSKRNKLPTAVN